MEDFRSMNTPPPPPPPTWVRKRDGRQEPFEADKISRALFAAAESAGHADPFLTRELADVVTHFLADEATGEPTTEQVGEVVGKVLRELKQYALASAFEEHARQKNHLRLQISDCRLTEDNLQSEICNLKLRAVYTRDLAAAHRDGLLTLGGLEAPGELASCLLSLPLPHDRPTARTATVSRSPRLLEALAYFCGQVAILDGPEYNLVPPPSQRPKRPTNAWAEREATGFLRELALGLRLSGRKAVLNLNGAPPPWADEAEQGPLFAAQGKETEGEWTAALSDALAEATCHPGLADLPVRIDWHLGASDFAAAVRERLVRLARLALAGAALSFVFDRPRRPLALAEGVQRRHPAVLVEVGLHLSRFAALVAEEVPAPQRAERLLERLKSLARLALSAAAQKRDFLRRHSRACPSLARGFLLDRARLLVVPIGLDAAVQTVLGRTLCSGGEALELGRAILRRLKEILRQEGRASALETCLDSPTAGTDHQPLAAAPGVTCWDEAAAVRAQLHTLGELHTAAEGGSGIVFLPADPLPAAEQVADWLARTWSETDVVRLRLLHALPSHRQLTFPVSESL